MAAVALASAVLATACASTSKPATATATAPAAAAAPAKTEVLTVQQVQAMVNQGMSFTDIMGEIQQSGTVYRLTDDQSQHLRGSAFSATLLSFMKLTYTHAIEANPALKKSNDQWHQIDGYWYGGRPFGWPEAWVVGAPRFGERWRKQ
jgi:PBP1b-binding outer membrane lipoprotein LpoB